MHRAVTGWRVKRKTKKYEKVRSKYEQHLKGGVQFETDMHRLKHQVKGQRLEQRMWVAGANLQEAKDAHAKALERHANRSARPGMFAFMRRANP